MNFGKANDKLLENNKYILNIIEKRLKKYGFKTEFNRLKRNNNNIQVVIINIKNKERKINFKLTFCLDKLIIEYDNSFDYANVFFPNPNFFKDIIKISSDNELDFVLYILSFLKSFGMYQEEIKANWL